ncbi:MAG TPA: STAS domain-containing protein [Candidatus Dormibacteraeota bacterium]|nr:STAS domain-containing protein [Candidatus Dormibacteraeota bacterium]
MTIQVSSRHVDSVTIVGLQGKLARGEGTTALRDAIRGLLDQGHKKLLLHLGEIQYVDSAGIGELVATITTVRHHGGELKLLKPSAKVRELLEITKLTKVFDVNDDEPKALKSFR